MLLPKPPNSVIVVWCCCYMVRICVARVDVPSILEPACWRRMCAQLDRDTRGRSYRLRKRDSAWGGISSGRDGSLCLSAYKRKLSRSWRLLRLLIMGPPPHAITSGPQRTSTSPSQSIPRSSPIMSGNREPLYLPPLLPPGPQLPSANQATASTEPSSWTKPPFRTTSPKSAKLAQHQRHS